MRKRFSTGPHMVIGYGVLMLRLHDCRSLKVKRGIIKAIVSRIRNHFNASVAEVGENDVHQRAHIGFAVVGSDQKVINAKMDKLLDFVEDLGLAEMVDTEMEIFHL